MLIRQIFKDDSLLTEYMDECNKRGITNNGSLKSLKFDYFEHSAFFAGIKNNKIVEFSGVHNFDIFDKRYYRVGFRAASLHGPDYSNRVSKSLLKSSFSYSIWFPLQILYIEKHYGPQQFIITTNSEDSPGSKSYKMDIYLRKNPEYLTLLYENIEYLYTKQNVWLLDRNNFINNFVEHHERNLNICLNY